ncbi:hypothetical protein HYH03_001298 [Edaphochlamys debaryana]|uniref:Uncharacterized protein n=1 Tax=Edaphochlamys debaryana TaxID=47281 RepID=A0A835YDC4_9CHLO|nr:hypothetical protein HYH03_001298 [Edaphochlamys debaryana]|eukprot:KAG2500521.1 hypothetical protein HYH03_001298 [Edaphochlamys debaryana]
MAPPRKNPVEDVGALFGDGYDHDDAANERDQVGANVAAFMRAKAQGAGAGAAAPKAAPGAGAKGKMAPLPLQRAGNEAERGAGKGSGGRTVAQHAHAQAAAKAAAKKQQEAAAAAAAAGAGAEGAGEGEQPAGGEAGAGAAAGSKRKAEAGAVVPAAKKPAGRPAAAAARASGGGALAGPSAGGGPLEELRSWMLQRGAELEKAAGALEEAVGRVVQDGSKRLEAVTSGHSAQLEALANNSEAACNTAKDQHADVMATIDEMRNKALKDLSAAAAEQTQALRTEVMARLEAGLEELRGRKK